MKSSAGSSSGQQCLWALVGHPSEDWKGEDLWQFQITETSCKITSELGYRKQFLVVQKGRTFGRKWKHTFKRVPDFEKKKCSKLKRKRLPSALFWQTMYISSVWTTLKFGWCLCSPPEGTDSWRCFMARINLLCLPDFSSLISGLCICQKLSLGNGTMHFINKKGLKGKIPDLLIHCIIWCHPQGNRPLLHRCH